MKLKKRRLWAVTVCLAGGWPLEPGHAGSTVYRCTGPQGRVEFSQQPCRSADQETVRIEDYRIGSVRPHRMPAPRRGRARPRGKKKTRASAPDARHCQQKRAQLDHLEWQMRRGYRASRSAKLHERREAYEEYLWRFCR